MGSRDSFLARVRQAAEQGRQYRIHLRPIADEIGYIGAGGDLCERFAEEVNAVGGEAFLVEDLRGAREQLKMLLTEAVAASAVCWQREILDRLGLSVLLGELQIELFDHARLGMLSVDEQRRQLLACDVGITSCDCAIAETGTLMMCSRPGQERVASLLPPMHIAVVERRQIVPDLIDAFGILGRMGMEATRQMTNDQAPMTNEIQNLPSNVTFITGPSKTGDIELQLTTGVHGPGKWRVIVVAEGDRGQETGVSRG